MIEVKCGNYASVLEKMEENSVDLMWTCPSPFRHYEDHGDWIGGEGSIHDYIKNLVDLCVSCSRVIKITGSFFIQLGDKFDKNGHLYGIPAIFEHSMRGMGFALHDRLIWHRCLDGETNLFIKRDGIYEFISIYELYNSFSDNIIIPSQDKNGNLIWVKIKQIFYNNKQKTKKIITKSGNEIICTDNHIFPIRRSSSRTKKFRQLSFKRCDELDKQDRFYVNDKISMDLPEGTDYDYKHGYLVGFYMAEGCWGKINKKTNTPYSIRLSCGKMDFERNNLDIFLDMAQFKYYDYGRGCIEVNTTDNSIINIILRYVDSNGCKLKKFKNTIFNRNIKFISGIMDGFLKGDGYYDIKNDRYVINLSPNHKLKDQLQMICRILGYDFRFIGDRKSIKKDKQWDNIRFTIRKTSKRSYYMGCKLDRIDYIENYKELDTFNIELEPYYPETIINCSKKYNYLYFLSNGVWTHNSETVKIKENNDFGFRKNYEFIYHFVHRDFFFNIRSKYKNTSIFSYPLEDTYFTNEFDSGLPSELMKIAIDTSTKEGDTVLDPLAGSFKTGIIAKKMGRNFIGIDIDPKICELGRIRLGLS